MVYLGVVVSYGPFERQSCAYRIKAATGNKHRLAKILHCKRLSLNQRVRLYVACVRSSLLYGQHAVGVTAEVMRKLEQFDSRALRAIARAPAHLTKESTVHLRERLKVDSPTTTLRKLLDRRADGVGEQRHRDKPRSHETLPSCTSLVPVDGDLELGVACPECGLYFASHRHVQSHRARQHGAKGNNARKRPGVLSAALYAANTVDGMPTCLHCHKQFTRVEGLKKHINSGCSATRKASRDAGDATEDLSKVLDPRVELPRGRAPQATPADSVLQPTSSLMQDSDFVAQVARDWKSVVRMPSYVSALREHCVICGQWCEAIKQHGTQRGS